MHFLYGIPGQLKLLLTRIASAVATEAKQDIIDTNVDTLTTNLSVVDANVDAIKADTDAFLDASIANIPTSSIRAIYQSTAISSYGSLTGDTTIQNFVEVTGITGITDYTKTLVLSGGSHTDTDNPTFVSLPLGTSGSMVSNTVVRIYCSRNGAYVNLGDKAVNDVTFTIIEFY